MFIPTSPLPLPPILRWKFLTSESFELQLPAHFVFLGDFSGHSPLWDDARHDSRGQTLEQTLNDYKLCLLRTGEHTYIYIDTSHITLFLFLMYMSVILLLHLSSTGKLTTVFVEVIASH